MDGQTQNFLNILNTVFTGEVHSLQEPDWRLLCKAAKQQSVIPLFAEGLSKYPEYADAPQAMKRQLLVKSLNVISNQVQRTEEFLSCYAELLKAGIRPLVVKGVVCRTAYGKLGDHRPSGDEDIYIKKEDFNTCKAVLTSLGFSSETADVDNKLLEQMQEITFSSPNGLEIEVHTNLLGRENKTRVFMSELFKNAFDDAIPFETEGGQIVYTMTPTMHYIFLFFHLYRHFTAAGVGIRQIADIAMFYKAYKEQIDLDEAERIFVEIGADKLYADVLAAAELLGLHVPTRLQGYNCEKLVADMMESGAFGYSSAAHSYGVHVTMAVVVGEDSGRSGLLNALFPPASLLISRYPELAEKPWLLPFVWVKRAFKSLTERHNSKISAEGYAIGKRRVELMKEYGLTKK